MMEHGFLECEVCTDKTSCGIFVSRRTDIINFVQKITVNISEVYFCGVWSTGIWQVNSDINDLENQRSVSYFYTFQ